MLRAWNVVTGGIRALRSAQNVLGSSIVMALDVVTTIVLVLAVHLMRLVDSVLRSVVSVALFRRDSRLVRSPMGRFSLCVVLNMCVTRRGAKVTFL